ncbi:sigma factor binding protein 1, chloroplastic-like [Melia azedarach]|uniref:Sigma factor binding protein 1, chloroplastic-like n=1 Tax=Melia azedarach TaxID=155640 RepID=A0ACC1YAW1_MELAZ|nr:sigma factor binding protein 1, chloroplastic-like [Melia azedarach]
MGRFGQQFDLQNPNKTPKGNAKTKKNPIKVTYISTPMKVKASSASEFRAIVQELTGKNSDVGDYNNNNSSDDSFTTVIPDLPEDDAAKHVIVNREVDDQLTRISTNTTADAYNLLGDHAFSGHLSSFELDERLFWRDFSAESSSFGFQSPCVSLYD